MTEEQNLSQAFQLGLRAIREREVDEAHVVVLDGNFALIDIGIVGLPDLYEELEAGLYVRAPLSFPHAVPYGFVTIPYLNRKDRQPVERQHRNHQHARKLQQTLGVSNTGFWSWSWDRMPKSRPEDLVAIVEWARKRLREG